MTALAEIAKTLRTTEKVAPGRIIRMRIGITCSRCGGSGSYSFNQMDGSRCYGCNGHSQVMPKTDAQWQAVAESAQRVATDGTLDAYIAQRQSEARCKNGSKRVMAAWQKMDKLNGYGKNWMKPTEQVAARNKVGFDLHTYATDFEGKVMFKKPVDWTEYERRLTDGLAELARMTAELESEAAQ